MESHSKDTLPTVAKLPAAAQPPPVAKLPAATESVPKHRVVAAKRKHSTKRRTAAGHDAHRKKRNNGSSCGGSAKRNRSGSGRHKHGATDEASAGTDDSAVESVPSSASGTATTKTSSNSGTSSTSSSSSTGASTTITQSLSEVSDGSLPSLRQRWDFRTLDDLINVACDKRNHDCPEVRRLVHTVPALLVLRDIVGQEKLKIALMEQVLYFCQGFERDEMLNMCLLGGPGLGKSLVCGIICDIYQRLRILPHFPGDEETMSNTEEKFLRGTKSTLVARFLGQTAPKAKALIDRCIRESKILLIDEVYQLNNSKADDSFSTDAINQINQCMTENAGKFIVIIAGYKEDVKRNFFATNDGLEGRFGQNMFTFEEYSPAELRSIFLLKAEDENWLVDETAITEDWFRQNKQYFPNQARDIDTLFVKSKMAHAKRVFGHHESIKRRLTQDDLARALDRFVEMRKSSDESDAAYRHMYT